MGLFMLAVFGLRLFCAYILIVYCEPVSLLPFASGVAL